MKKIKTTLKEYLKELWEKAEHEMSDMPYYLIEDIVKWPQVQDMYSNQFSAPEPLDVENFEWLIIGDDKMVICCGGDWQLPKTLTIEIVDSYLTVTKSEDGFNSEGMNEDDFIKIVQ